ncbi:MAG: PspA/IM30 family protein [bacterium]|nr:PspA/IM30 family protein [bacterium]
MNDFFDKLNTLVRVKLSDLLGESKSTTHSDDKSSSQPIQQVAKDAENLRARVNDAIGYEDKLQAQIVDINKQLVTLNRQADDATEKGNEAMARYFIEKIQRLEDRLLILEKDLQEHQLLAQDLIQKVSTLEATIATIQEQKPATSPVADSTETPKNVADKFSELVSDAQKRINTLGDRIKARKETLQSEIDAPLPTSSVTSSNMPTDSDIEDDLERRRNRLSKK